MNVNACRSLPVSCTIMPEDDRLDMITLPTETITLMDVLAIWL